MGMNQQTIERLLPSSLNTAIDKKRRFPWFKNKPLPEHFGEFYGKAMDIFRALDGDEQGLQSKRLVQLVPDCYLPPPYNCLVEFDEVQHFTAYKLKALQLYPAQIRYGFDLDYYKELCQKYSEEALLKGAGTYRAPKVEFPFENGRAAQRAFFDMFRDFLPTLHGLNPTVRITEFEVEDILTVKLSTVQAQEKLYQLIKHRLGKDVQNL